MALKCNFPIVNDQRHHDGLDSLFAVSGALGPQEKSNLPVILSKLTILSVHIHRGLFKAKQRDWLDMKELKLTYIISSL